MLENIFLKFKLINKSASKYILGGGINMKKRQFFLTTSLYTIFIIGTIISMIIVYKDLTSKFTYNFVLGYVFFTFFILAYIILNYCISFIIFLKEIKDKKIS